VLGSNVGFSPLAHLIELGNDMVVPVEAVVNSTRYSLSIVESVAGARVIVNDED
jgi:hypothetical protein